MRIDEPGADLGIALAIASAAKGVPVREGLAAFGEIGLTGRLRPATQADRRVEECRKLGSRRSWRRRHRRGDDRGETLRAALAAALGAEPRLSRDFRENPAKVAVLQGFCYPVVLAGGAFRGRRHFRDYRRKRRSSLYKVGDKVVYPHHGAGTVVKREKREVLGEKREYLTIKILHNDMTVNVPRTTPSASGCAR